MKFMFNNPSDMIALAKHVQTCVYWNSNYRYDNDDDESYPYRDFWEDMANFLDAGACGVEIVADVVYIIYE